MNPVYSLENIHFSYGPEFSLEIKEALFKAGTLYSLLGHNGSGKSTLLKIMALLLRPQTGAVVYQGREVSRYRSQAQGFRRAVTLVEQTPFLFSGTVHRNLAFGLQLRGISGPEQDSRIADALRQVGLPGFASHSSRQLSYGELQRIALARALALDPQVLLLDEPTSNSDQAYQKIFAGLMLDLKDQGKTVVIASHDLKQVRDLGAEILYLDQGRLTDPPYQKRDRPHLVQVDKHLESI